MAKEVGNYFGRNVVPLWRNGDEDMIEWNKRKGGHMFEIAECYERGRAKASNELYRIISSLDPMMYS